jgi:hypothetical protein
MAGTLVIKGGQGFMGEDFYSERGKYLQDLIRRQPLSALIKEIAVSTVS